MGEQGRFEALDAVSLGRRPAAMGSRAGTAFIASDDDADAAANQEAGGTMRLEPGAA